MNRCKRGNLSREHLQAFTLIEIVIVVAIVGILMTIAMPAYQSYVLRVHRTQAIGALVLASMCQESLYANNGSYDTNRCQPDFQGSRYQLSYSPKNTKGLSFTAMATPAGSQLDDPCGSLSLDQLGTRTVSAEDVSILKCWSGR